MSPFIVSGISTGVGKTIISTLLVEALQADYWKPIQTGKESDRETLSKLISNPRTTLHKEIYHFPDPLSPHHAAKLVQVKIDLRKFTLPITSRPLVIEGAGGLLSPLSNDVTQWDFFSKWHPQWILVVSDYLGSINHTLLSLALLKDAVTCVVLNQVCQENEEFLMKYIRPPVLKIPFIQHLNPQSILWHSCIFSGTPFQI